MKTTSGLTVFIDNTNDKLLAPGFVSADIDTAVNNGFIIPKLTANLTVPIPTSTKSGRNITFKITQGASAFTVTWTGGAGGYMFPSSVPSLDSFNAMLAEMPNDAVLYIGFKFDSTLNRYVCVALSGYYI